MYGPPQELRFGILCVKCKTSESERQLAEFQLQWTTHKHTPKKQCCLQSAQRVDVVWVVFVITTIDFLPIPKSKLTGATVLRGSVEDTGSNTAGHCSEGGLWGTVDPTLGGHCAEGVCRGHWILTLCAVPELCATVLQMQLNFNTLQISDPLNTSEVWY